MGISRRSFLALCAGALLISTRQVGDKKTLITVLGPIDGTALGTTLIHEHFLVDFIGADKISPDRWEREEVIKKVLPYLMQAKDKGVKTILDCTPAYLGRDPLLLRALSQQSGMQLITNTGYYGARQNQHLPAHAFTDTAAQLAGRWIAEFSNGIEGSGVRPGFIKIGVDAEGGLSELHQKLCRAAALTHLQTGLTICSHTGAGAAAFAQIRILAAAGVAPDAFVWVHAQAEGDKLLYVKAASLGAWVSLDGIGWGDFDQYAASLQLMKSENLLHRVLISHDAGWYKPEEPEGAFVGYTNIFTELMPRLQAKGFTQGELDQLLLRNPLEAFSIRVRGRRK